MQTVEVKIDCSIEYQKIDGWGIVYHIDWNWEGPNQYPIPHQDVMNQIKEMGIDYVENFANRLFATHEQTNDDKDPFNYNWVSYNAQLANMDHVFKRLQYQQNAGLKIYLSSHAKPSWLYSDSSGNFDQSNLDELAEYFTSLLLYAKTKYGLNIDYLSLQIEPT